MVKRFDPGKLHDMVLKRPGNLDYNLGTFGLWLFSTLNLQNCNEKQEVMLPFGAVVR
jgi:hypothetical protein